MGLSCLMGEATPDECVLNFPVSDHTVRSISCWGSYCCAYVTTLDYILCGVEILLLFQVLGLV